ncbi:maleylpyruvate isomerase family mycothiol-dependent enzyme [Saccharothrix sp. 6-C]|uniref:maleylpyruvate isomerase family mycothiol-dependent enzyme n=1 Tax=Saccharothrix sp. 6-C TaxID=2781735 RepID=UPI00191776E7|nr:maleylpyruvate isomerase family mycothiol-dependent enzyme [Saccharothrix sp. 6-C]QQQ78400.1 maleylpyruvate isomerase family mycothiol-dependent enzyme [Saccharothrix sp. 6-C]
MVSQQWPVVRDVLSDVTGRFADLVAASDPDALATPDWTVADTAAHVVAIASIYTTLLVPGGAELTDPALAARIPTVTVDTVADLNDLALRRFTERDPAALAAMLRSMVATILDRTAGTDPERTVPWLGASKVPVAGVLAHLVNELLIHGWDIARGVGTPWSVPPGEAALFFELFLVGMMRNDVGSVLDGQPPGDRRIAVAFRSPHTTPVTIVLHRGRVTVGEPGEPVDVRLSFDPAVLNLVLFGRVSRARAVLTGKLRITGRRPWLLPAFLRTVRLPTNSVPLSAG